MTNSVSRSLELMRIQAEASFDRRGRIVGCYGITIASGEDGHALWIGADVPDEMADELTAAFDRASPASAPTEPPPALDLCEKILGLEGVERAAGPSYLIPPDTRFASDVAIVRSGGPGVDRLRGANPGNWHPVEWDELLGGRLGPWAIATSGEHAISICHTPVPLTARAAECGVWTDPPFRGRGYAAATAAEWVTLVRSPGRHLFYSTSAANHSSQRVARRLGLRELGWKWRLHRPRGAQGDRIHPLSSVSERAKT
jgi:hypothetical protein